MATIARPEAPVSNLNRRQGIIADLRAKVRTSRSLASDVEAALTELEKVASDDVSDLCDVLDFIEDVVNGTPDAELREKLLGIRQTIAAHPNASLEALGRLI